MHKHSGSLCSSPLRNVLYSLYLTGTVSSELHEIAGDDTVRRGCKRDVS